jgi:mediator of RNA polymerase II transcription subunit 13, fungi type
MPLISGGGFDFGDGFGAFTDDDFSFFDNPVVPSNQSIAPAAHLVPHVDMPLPSALLAPTVLDPLSFASAGYTGPSTSIDSLPLGLPTDIIHPSSWPLPTSTFPSLELEHETPVLAPPLPSPRGTPPALSYPTPVTPIVKVVLDENGSEFTHPPHRGYFEPLPFAASHRASDDKYEKGKFSLPSPLDTEDRTATLDLSSSPVSWRSEYTAVTDPRVSMVRRLIGVKRKSFDEGHAPEHHRSSPQRIRIHERENEEWAYPTPGTDDADEEKSDVESDDEASSVVEQDQRRSVTPTPNYIPPGPALLATQFHHSLLLPQSKPLHHGPPNLSAPTPTATLASVPTPVSPEAIASAISEKARSLEAAMQILARELVENSLWAQEWMSIHSSTSMLAIMPVPKDLHVVLDMGNTQVNDPVDLRSLAHDTMDGADELNTRPLVQLDSPSLLVSKTNSILTILPSALRFWEKLGLGPRAGKKDVQAYVCFQDGSIRAQAASAWLKDVGVVYNVCEMPLLSLCSHVASYFVGT